MTKHKEIEAQLDEITPFMKEYCEFCEYCLPLKNIPPDKRPTEYVCVMFIKRYGENVIYKVDLDDLCENFVRRNHGSSKKLHD